MSESWRPVVGYEGIYEVSDHGRVRRVLAGQGARPGYILSPTQAGRGYAEGRAYPSVCIYKGRTVARRNVHQLVAEAFIGPRPEGMHINHKDSDKSNNHATNLEYVTPSENYWHAVEAGAIPGVKPREVNE